MKRVEKGGEPCLSGREKEILERLSKGFSVKEASQSLFIEYETVRTHLKHIYKKMHVRCKKDAIDEAKRRKEIGFSWY